MLISKWRYLSLFNVFFFLTKYFIIFGKDADQGHRGLPRTKDHILYCLSLCCTMDIGKSEDPFSTVFSSCQGHASTRYLFSVKATNKLKSKVLKNNTINGKNLRIIWWMVKEGQKGDSTYRAQRKAFPLIKEEFRKLIFHSLAYKIATFECE